MNKWHIRTEIIYTTYTIHIIINFDIYVMQYELMLENDLRELTLQEDFHIRVWAQELS